MLILLVCLTFYAVNVDRGLGDKRHHAPKLPMTGHYKPSSETSVMWRLLFVVWYKTFQRRSRGAGYVS
jgi:hypothetical protein